MIGDPAVNGTSPIKRRRRRSQAEMAAIKDAIYSILEEDHPQTVRQVFYRLTSIGAIEKTEAEYKRTVCRLLADMRRAGDIPYTWLADATRWRRKPRTYDSMEDALRRTAETYRRSLWDGAGDAVEVWLEKEALAGVLVEVTDEWDVPLMVTRGYASMSFLHSAAEEIRYRGMELGQRTQLYYFGDRDPSGQDIQRAIVSGIGESLISLGVGSADYQRPDDPWPVAVFNAFATFNRIAVTEEQIEELSLPTRPTKKADTRSKGFTGDSVEVDAIPAAHLRLLAEEAIEGHVDAHQLQVLKKVEAEERAGLEQIVATLGTSVRTDNSRGAST